MNRLTLTIPENRPQPCPARGEEPASPLTQSDGCGVVGVGNWSVIGLPEGQLTFSDRLATAWRSRPQVLLVATTRRAGTGLPGDTTGGGAGGDWD